MMQQPNGTEKLCLNRTTDCYEATIVIKVEAEIFQRAFFRHVEENHIDITDPEALQRAIDDVSRVVKWLEHPRTQKVIAPITGPLVSTPPLTLEAQSPKPKAQAYNKNLTIAEQQAIREQALQLPIDQWEEKLLTPLPLAWNGANHATKNALYQHRYAERKVLQDLKRELEAPLDTRIEAIAGAVNGVRMH